MYGSPEGEIPPPEQPIGAVLPLGKDPLAPALPPPMPEAGAAGAPEHDLTPAQEKAAGRVGALARRSWQGLRSFGSTVHEVWDSARSEVAGAGAIKNIGRLSLLGANVIGIAAEQVVVNETVLGNVAGWVLAHNEGLLAGFVGTAGATGATSFFTQAGLGTATALSLKMFPQTMATIRGKLNKSKLQAVASQAPAENGPQQAEAAALPKRSMRTRFTNAFVLGTSLVTIGRNAKHELSIAQNERDILGDAALVGAGVTILGGTVGAITNALRGTRFEVIGDAFVSVLTSPLTYLGYFSLVQYQNAKKRQQAAK